MWVFANMSKEALTKKKNMSQVQIISNCQKTINIIHCVQEGASLIITQRTVKKEMHCLNIKSTRTKLIESILETV